MPSLVGSEMCIRDSPSFGPFRSKTRPDRSRIFFWTSADLCTAFLTNYVRGGERYTAVWKITKCHAPYVTVGRINSQSVVARCGGGGWAGHEPTAAAYCTHKYNWSITTARTLSITLHLSWGPSIQPTVVYMVCSPLVLSLSGLCKRTRTMHTPPQIKGIHQR